MYQRKQWNGWCSFTVAGLAALHNMSMAPSHLVHIKYHFFLELEENCVYKPSVLFLILSFSIYPHSVSCYPVVLIRIRCFQLAWFFLHKTHCAHSMLLLCCSTECFSLSQVKWEPLVEKCLVPSVFSEFL